MSSFDVREFESPGREWRPTVFWAWNEELDTEEIDAQIESMRRQGLGGFFMHSRSGLRTEYMSDEWMAVIRHAQRSARAADMNSWLYDEDRWPSGFAGGIVPAAGDHHRQKCLEASLVSEEHVDAVLDDPRTLALFEVREADAHGSLPEVVRRVENSEDRVRTPGAVLVAFQGVIGDRSNWRNGETYADMLNPATAEEFLRVTYDAYAAQIDLDEHTPGIFTDEPTVTLFSAEKGLRLPWTGAFAEEFERRAGEDLIAQLPSLYFTVGAWRRVRFFFWKTVCDLFADGFVRQCYDRAGDLGIAFTGHFLFEENLVRQTVSNGAVMPLYQFQQIPGVDQLGPTPGAAITYKQVSSVANQLGRPRVISETLGASGQGLSIEEQKAIFDYQLALGVNMFTKHIGLYSMTGERKRDYPPNIGYQQSYSDLLRPLHDYVSRCTYAVSSGTAGGGVLLLHPIATAWALIGGGLTPQTHAEGRAEVDYEAALALFTKSDESRNVDVERYEEQFNHVLSWLIGHHFTFDLGDESLLAAHARIEGDTLRVGQQEYRVVVVPPILNIGSGTLRLLREFEAAGGTVISLGEAPTLVDGLPTDVGFEPLPVLDGLEQLTSVVDRPVRVLDADGNDAADIVVHHRRDGDHDVLFFVNTSPTASVEATVRLAGTRDIHELLPMTGGSADVDAAHTDGVTAVSLSFPPRASRLLIARTR